ncbi:MAG: LacI family DNA-binding transcriptional regulator [Faecousia sp.]
MDDIAKRLGISKGTVSKAFSGAGDVSEAMRRAVLETAVELGYTRLPRSCQPTRLCVFIENMSYEHPNDFGWDLVTGFRKLAEPDGCVVDLIPLSQELQKQNRYDEYMLRHNYQGAFFLGISFSDVWMAEFRTCRTPTVLLDNSTQYNSVVSQVGIDNDEAMEAAIDRLKNLGHRKIGYISGGLGSYIYQERYLAFFRALRKHKLEEDRLLAGHSCSVDECLDSHLPRLLAQGCTALICSHDLLARDVMTRCQRSGIRVPEDLSILGIDDLPLCQATAPTLSSIRQDRTELGKSAYYALSSQIRQIHISCLKLHPEVILRESVGPAL